MRVTTAIGYLKKWVIKAFEGRGFLKGSQCKIDSVTDVPSPIEPTVPISKIIKFKWDRSESGSMTPIWTETDVEVADMSRQIYEIKQIPEKRTGDNLYYEVTYYDGSTGFFYVPMSSSSLRRVVVSVLPPISEAELNTIYMVPDGTSGNYSQFLLVFDVATSRYQWLNIGSTKVDLTQYLKKIDETLIERHDFKNPDPLTKVTQPLAAAVAGAINETETRIGGKYDYETNKITGLNTYNNESIVAALNNMGNLSDLESWNPLTETPATLVDAINESNKTYNLTDETTIDRTKYTGIKKLKVDYHDGSGETQVGTDIQKDRVDVEMRATPESSSNFVDYRTYDVKLANATYDSGDASMKLYGQVHVPKIQLKKVYPVIATYTETFTPTAFVQTMPNDWQCEVTLAHQPVPSKASEAVITFAPEIGGSKNLAVTSTSKVAKVNALGATGVPVVGTTTVTVEYKGESESIAAQYFLQIEDKDYDIGLCGDMIDIGKDSFLYDVSVKVCTVEDDPPGAHIGDKYIDMDFLKSDGSHIHAKILVKDLIHESAGKDAIKVTYDSATEKNIVSLKINPDTTTYPANESLGQTNDGLHITTANHLHYGATKFAELTEILEADAKYQAIRPIDVLNFLRSSDKVEEYLGNFYVDPISGEMINNTTIKAINELATEAITKNDLRSDKDVATYSYTRTPVGGSSMLLSTIHDLQQVYQVLFLSSVVEPKEYEIYYSINPTTIGGVEYVPGLYMWDKYANKWKSVTDRPIIDVTDLSGMNIKKHCIYRLTDERTVVSRYSVKPSAASDGWYMNKDGLHNHKDTPHIDLTWAQVKENWATYSGNVLTTSSTGKVFYVQNATGGDFELIWNYTNESGALFHNYGGAWHQINVMKITEIDIEDIENEYMIF